MKKSAQFEFISRTRTPEAFLPGVTFTITLWVMWYRWALCYMTRSMQRGEVWRKCHVRCEAVPVTTVLPHCSGHKGALFLAFEKMWKDKGWCCFRLVQQKKLFSISATFCWGLRGGWWYSDLKEIFLADVMPERWQNLYLVWLASFLCS